MARQEPNLEFFELVQVMNLGTATPQQVEKLEQILLTDPDARQAYYDTLDVDQGLRELAVDVPPFLKAATSGSIEKNQSWARYIRRTLSSAAIFLVGMGLGAWLISGSIQNEPPTVQRISVSPPAPHFVATLVRSTDCEWEDEASPFFEGKRLLSSELRMKHGVAEFRLETGVRLVLEGPVQLLLDSDRSALLSYGKLVLHGHEFADGFELRTAKTTLIDIGTEYGVSVDKDSNVELHVFQGTVQAKSTSTEESIELIEAGVAKRFSTEESENVPLRPDLFQREVPGNAENNSFSPVEILAFDRFKPAKEGESDDRAMQGGSGWKGGWIRDLSSKTPFKGIVDSKINLHPNGNRGGFPDGALRLSAVENIAWRELQRPVRLDVDGIYYVSFFMKKLTQASPSTPQYGSLSLRTGNVPRDEFRINFGMSSTRLPILVHNEQKHQVAPPLALGVPYFYVAKIVAGAQTPDEVRVRVFSSDETVPDQEPHAWTCISTPSYDDTVYTHVSLYVQGVDYAFDDIRIASSWQAATNFTWPDKASPFSD